MFHIIIEKQISELGSFIDHFISIDECYLEDKTPAYKIIHHPQKNKSYQRLRVKSFKIFHKINVLETQTYTDDALDIHIAVRCYYLKKKYNFIYIITKPLGVVVLQRLRTWNKRKVF